MTSWILNLSTGNEQETRDVGKILGRDLMPGDLLALTGDLGSGKTCLTQGIARGFHVPETENVRSPTFILLNIYRGRHPLFHMDLYRLQDPEELEDLGYREIFFGEGVTVIEWAERARDLLPGDRLHIHLSFLGENRRRMALEALGDRFRERRDAWATSLEPYRSIST